MYFVLGNVISTEIHVWKKNLYVISIYLQLENSIPTWKNMISTIHFDKQGFGLINHINY